MTGILGYARVLTGDQDVAGCSIEYGQAVESWGVRRIDVLDPLGLLVNIPAHGLPDERPQGER